MGALYPEEQMIFWGEWCKTRVYLITRDVGKNPEAGTTTIMWQCRVYCYGNAFDRDYYWDFTIDGKNFSGTKYMEITKDNDHLIASGTFDVKHNDRGDAKTVYLSVAKVGFDDATIFFPACYWYSASDIPIDLSAINRQATMSFVNGFTDEDSISIGYYNPAKSAATVEVAISLDGGTNYNIPFRKCDPLSSMYYFNLTENERYILWWGNRNGNKATATFVLRTTIGSYVAYSKMSKEYTIINCEPSLDPKVKDTDSYINSLTGNDQKFILGYSDLYFDSKADPKKAATIDYQWIRCGSTTLEDYTSNTGTIENIDSGTVYFEVKNSRGYITNKAAVLDVIPYTKLTARLETSLFRADGSVTFTLKGIYFDDTFGKQHNSMQVQYSLRDEDGNFAQVPGVRESGWVELGVVQPNTSNGTYEFSHEITGLDYEKTWELTVSVLDALTPLQEVTTVVAPLPIFDWSGTDFHHHTDVSLSAGTNLYLGDIEISGDNKILWADGGWHMRARETIYLNEPISKQANGIVLVFSLFRNNSMEDVSFNSFFVSKKEVEILPGKPHTFIMGINAGFSKIGAKYIYISDDSMTGDDTNVSNGTNSGITFDNYSFVLRYVIGV